MEQQENPCCHELKKRYAKLEEKRNALRQAVKLLEHQIGKIEAENVKLKQEVQSERGRAETEKEGREKDSAGKLRLEEELNNMRLELSHLREEKCKIQSGNDIRLFESRALDAEAEVKRLNKLLNDEKKKVDFEKKKAEIEKKRASEAWVLVKTERKKDEEDRRLREFEKKKLDQSALVVEEMTSELNSVREELIIMRNRAEDAVKIADIERQKADKERKNAEAESLKVESLRKVVEADKKKADTERSKLESVRKAVEADKKNLEAERSKLEALRKAFEAEKKKILEETSHADHLDQQLKAEAQKRGDLEKEMTKRIKVEKGRSQCHTYGDHVKAETCKNKFLKEALKLEKKRTKCAKRFAKIQEAEKNLLRRELDSLKQSFSQFTERLHMVDHFLQQKDEGRSGCKKLDRHFNPEGFDQKGELSNDLTQCYDLRSRNELTQAQLKNLCSNCSDAARAYAGQVRPDLGVNCHPPGSGINSDLESPTGDSLRQKKQSSVSYSTTASFSDGKFMGSQDRGQYLSVPATELRCKSTSCMSSEVTKFAKGKYNGALIGKYVGHSIPREDRIPSLEQAAYDAVNPENYGHIKKKRKIEDMLETVARLCSEDKRTHLKIEENLAAISDLILEKKHLHNDKLHEIKNSKVRGDKSKKRKSGKILIDRSKNIKEPVTTGNMPSNSHVDCRQNDGQFVGQDNACPDKPNNLCDEDHVIANLSCFEDRVHGNIMKFLGLEDDSDEERYKAAVAMPLSPTLPVLDPPSPSQFGNGDSYYLLADVLNRVMGYEESNASLSDSLDVVDLEIGLSTQKTRSSHVLEGAKPCEILDFPNEGRSLGTDTIHSQVIETPMEYGHASIFEFNSLNVNVPMIISEPSIDSQVAGLVSCPNPHLPVENAVKTCYVANFNLKETQVCTPSCSVGPNLRSLSTRDSLTAVSDQSDFIQDINQLNQLGSVPEQNESSKSFMAGFPTGYSVDFPEGEVSDLPLANTSVNENKFFCGKDLPLATGCPSVLVDDSEKDSPTAKKSSCNFVFNEFESSGMEAVVEVREPSDANRCEDWVPSMFSIVHCSPEDEHVICSVGSAILALECKKPLVKRDEHKLGKILHTILDINLQPEEKVCVFLSVLIDYYSALLSATSANSETSFDCSMLSELLKADIQTVFSDAVVGPLFLDICRRGGLLVLIQDFLMGRDILNCVPIGKSLLNSCISQGKVHHLSGMDVYISSQIASANQLIATSLILASFCSVLNGVDFVREVSCNILLNCGNESSWSLAVVHTFASVCGADYFSSNEDNISAIVVKSAVLLMESCQAATNSRLNLQHTGSNNLSKFYSCENCPFAQDSVCVDEVIEVLLRKLEEFLKLGFSHCLGHKATLCSTQIYPESSLDNNALPHSNVNNYTSLASSRNSVRTHSSDLFLDGHFLGFMDTLSHFELIGSHLDWDQTSEKILPHLMRALKSCPIEEYSVALLILVGKLSRLAIAAVGYTHNSLDDVREAVLRYLDQSTCMNSRHLLQFAAFEAMIDLMPTKFEEIAKGVRETSDFSSHRLSEHWKLMRGWYSQLSHEHKLSVERLFNVSDRVLNS